MICINVNSLALSCDLTEDYVGHFDHLLIICLNFEIVWISCLLWPFPNISGPFLFKD